MENTFQSSFSDNYTVLKKLLFNKWFLGILAVKILFSFFFASDVFVKGFLPFIDHFVSSGFQNSYEVFTQLGDLRAFPYPSGMLLVMAIPRLIFSIFFVGSGINFLQIFALHVPVLLADIVIYCLLGFLLETKEKQVIWFYWASPILFYINYFHGQLDVIPTMFVLLSLFFLLKQKELWAFIILGFGLAVKSHLFIALPLYFVYLYVNKRGVVKSFQAIIVPLVVYLALTLPFLFSTGYQEMVINSVEQGKFFLLNFPYFYEQIRFLFAPGACLLLVFYFATYPKINQDMFIVIVGLLFSVLVILVPPMPGWFYWSVPFLAYFYIKRGDEAPTMNFWILNILYVLYFIFQKNGDFSQSFQLILPSFAANFSSASLLAPFGFDDALVSNVLFTGLEVSMLMNVLWCYKAGIKSNFLYKTKDQPLLIGIGGDSGAGKSSFALTLERVFGKNNTVCVNGDDVHKWARGHENWKIFTHLNPKSNYLHTELTHAVALKNGKHIERVHYDHDTGQFTNPQKMESNKFVLFVGLHTYYIEQMRHILDVKIFLAPDESLRRHWKIVRDMKDRGYSKEKVLSQLDQRAADSEKYIQPQKDKAELIFSYLPQMPIKEMGSDENVSIKLRVYFANSLCIDSLVDVLTPISSLSIETWYEDDLKNQCVEFKGSISTTEVATAAYSLVPNLKELLYNMSPEWESDYQGLSQLFIVFYISEISKQKKQREHLFHLDSHE